MSGVGQDNCRRLPAYLEAEDSYTHSIRHCLTILVRLIHACEKEKGATYIVPAQVRCTIEHHPTHDSINVGCP